ncbi:MAG: hypothetical protein K5885_10985 [Bacteroidales bacterium]|nr:hypothetical protein [Bacteroidales bacterium]
MGQRTNILLQIEGRSGARLNKVYHLQWGYHRTMPLVFLHLVAIRNFRPFGMDIFKYNTKSLDLEGILTIDRDWHKYNFNNLEDCQKVLNQCDNNNGAMVVVITENTRDHLFPTYKVGFLLGPERQDAEPAFSRWVSTQEFLQNQPRYETQKDDEFAGAFDILTTLFGTQHMEVQGDTPTPTD